MRECFKSQSLGIVNGGRELIRCSFDQAPTLGTVPVLPAPDSAGWIFSRDGRSMRCSSLPLLVAKSAASLPLALDIDHVAEWGKTEACAWAEAFEIKNGGLVARVEWLETGRALVESKAYRYSSPVLLVHETTREIESVVGLSLTNKAALPMEAVSLFRQKFSLEGPTAMPKPTDAATVEAYKRKVATARAVSASADEINAELLSKSLKQSEIDAARAYLAASKR